MHHTRRTFSAIGTIVVVGGKQTADRARRVRAADQGRDGQADRAVHGGLKFAGSTGKTLNPKGAPPNVAGTTLGDVVEQIVDRDG